MGETAVSSLRSSDGAVVEGEEVEAGVLEVGLDEALAVLRFAFCTCPLIVAEHRAMGEVEVDARANSAVLVVARERETDAATAAVRPDKRESILSHAILMRWREMNHPRW